MPQQGKQLTHVAAQRAVRVQLPGGAQLVLQRGNATTRSTASLRPAAGGLPVASLRRATSAIALHATGRDLAAVAHAGRMHQQPRAALTLQRWWRSQRLIHAIQRQRAVAGRQLSAMLRAWREFTRLRRELRRGKLRRHFFAWQDLAGETRTLQHALLQLLARARRHGTVPYTLAPLFSDQMLLAARQLAAPLQRAPSASRLRLSIASSAPSKPLGAPASVHSSISRTSRASCAISPPTTPSRAVAEVDDRLAWLDHIQLVRMPPQQWRAGVVGSGATLGDPHADAGGDLGSSAASTARAAAQPREAASESSIYRRHIAKLASTISRSAGLPRQAGAPPSAVDAQVPAGMPTTRSIMDLLPRRAVPATPGGIASRSLPAPQSTPSSDTRIGFPMTDLQCGIAGWARSAQPKQQCGKVPADRGEVVRSKATILHALGMSAGLVPRSAVAGRPRSQLEDVQQQQLQQPQLSGTVSSTAHLAAHRAAQQQRQHLGSTAMLRESVDALMARCAKHMAQSIMQAHFTAWANVVSAARARRVEYARLVHKSLYQSPIRALRVMKVAHTPLMGTRKQRQHRKPGLLSSPSSTRHGQLAPLSTPSSSARNATPKLPPGPPPGPPPVQRQVPPPPPATRPHSAVVDDQPTHGIVLARLYFGTLWSRERLRVLLRLWHFVARMQRLTADLPRSELALGLRAHASLLARLRRPSFARRAALQQRGAGAGAAGSPGYLAELPTGLRGSTEVLRFFGIQHLPTQPLLAPLVLQWIEACAARARAIIQAGHERDMACQRAHFSAWHQTAKLLAVSSNIGMLAALRSQAALTRSCFAAWVRATKYRALLRCFQRIAVRHWAAAMRRADYLRTRAEHARALHAQHSRRWLLQFLRDRLHVAQLKAAVARARVQHMLPVLCTGRALTSGQQAAAQRDAAVRVAAGAKLAAWLHAACAGTWRTWREAAQAWGSARDLACLALGLRQASSSVQAATGLLLLAGSLPADLYHHPVLSQQAAEQVPAAWQPLVEQATGQRSFDSAAHAFMRVRLASGPAHELAPWHAAEPAAPSDDTRALYRCIARPTPHLGGIALCALRARFELARAHAGQTALPGSSLHDMQRAATQLNTARVVDGVVSRAHVMRAWRSWANGRRAWRQAREVVGNAAARSTLRWTFQKWRGGTRQVRPRDAASTLQCRLTSLVAARALAAAAHVWPTRTGLAVANVTTRTESQWACTSELRATRLGLWQVIAAALQGQARALAAAQVVRGEVLPLQALHAINQDLSTQAELQLSRAVAARHASRAAVAREELLHESVAVAREAGAGRVEILERRGIATGRAAESHAAQARAGRTVSEQAKAGAAAAQLHALACAVRAEAVTAAGLSKLAQAGAAWSELALLDWAARSDKLEWPPGDEQQLEGPEADAE